MYFLELSAELALLRTKCQRRGDVNFISAAEGDQNLPPDFSDFDNSKTYMYHHLYAAEGFHLFLSFLPSSFF